MHTCTHARTHERPASLVAAGPVYARILMLDSPPLEPSLICLRLPGPYSLTHSLPSAAPSASPFRSPSPSYLPPISLLFSRSRTVYCGRQPRPPSQPPSPRQIAGLGRARQRMFVAKAAISKKWKMSMAQGSSPNRAHGSHLHIRMHMQGSGHTHTHICFGGGVSVPVRACRTHACVHALAQEYR